MRPGETTTKNCGRERLSAPPGRPSDPKWPATARGPTALAFELRTGRGGGRDLARTDLRAQGQVSLHLDPPPPAGPDVARCRAPTRARSAISSRSPLIASSAVRDVSHGEAVNGLGLDAGRRGLSPRRGPGRCCPACTVIQGYHARAARANLTPSCRRISPVRTLSYRSPARRFAWPSSGSSSRTGASKTHPRLR